MTIDGGVVAAIVAVLFTVVVAVSGNSRVEVNNVIVVGQ